VHTPGTTLWRASGRYSWTDFPPSSRQSRFTVGAACAAMSRPTAVEPVNDTQSTRGSLDSSRAPSAPSSTTTLSTPSGRPTSAAASPKTSADSGVRGLGRRTTEHPATSAEITFHTFVWNGKL